MNLQDLFGGFFSPEAGQRRRAWLDEQDRRITEGVRYFLGPQLAPQVERAAGMAALFSPGQDVVDAQQASRNLTRWDGPMDAAGDAATLAAALGSTLLPGGVASYRQGIEDLMDAGVRTHKSGQLNIFAGPGAANADRSALSRAEQMEQAGVDRDHIWRSTGWGRGVDDQWRFEIDDSAARVGLRPGETAPLPDALKHEQLNAAYPQLQRVDVAMTDEVDPGTQGVFMGALGEGGHGDATLWLSDRARAPRSTMLHEAQHAVQQIEGRQAGGNLVDAGNSAVAGEILEELRGEAQPMGFEEFFKNSGLEDRAMARHIFDNFVSDGAAEEDLRRKAAQEAYRRLAGEVEARNTQARRHMTAAERREVPPWATEDVPREKQLLGRH
ncbi:LPD23 domain-containing protein [Tranquillimonas alkanivorans]|uniref:Large polyvalent protein associated domain-containing protein n=1 Tax=Tranquillimonas alkanivorans TaxID=441119 RepID=A0A1I5PC38_9RHOB|nr:LPD23 domain-containing protein [Tranquillimonas alkanivorans]SFP31662.1 hypothetical protein SAMN04488047_10530 [Tranquillimonas alkanivorans]